MAGLVERLHVGAAWHSRCVTQCRKCQRELPDDAFSDWGLSRGECRECTGLRNREYGTSNREKRNARLRAWRRANPEAAKAKDLRARYKRKYGLTPEDVDAMKESQDGRCLICGVESDLFVDHCHSTGSVRGALCPSCNTFLGRIEANPDILDRMRDYAAGHLTSPWLASSNKTSA